MKNHSRLNANLPKQIPVFAITTRGLETVSAQELASCPGLTITQTAYRRVEALCDEPQPLTG
ncbi:MAG TPA: hypothetical protein VHO69_02890, partial [Phototrophicaceae bacterium]|nr:hypothetical protein [Phototrophicaceae bacterium]